jgi:two-component system sensor histidine kinase UhpB
MVTARVQECIDGRVPDYEVEHRMVHKDGTARWFLSRGTLMRRPNGSPHRMVGTKVDITARKVAEDAIRENQAILRATNQELQNLAGRLIASQEVERGRIARELHDDISQQVAGLSLALSGLKRRLAAHGRSDLDADLSALQQRTIVLAEEIRHVSHDLHPSVLQHAGLVAALTAHCAELQHGPTLTVALTTNGDFDATNRDVALCLYRVAQEALRNVVSHSGARRADVDLRRQGNLAELTVTDDGVGFDISHARTTLKGLGLVSITERVRLAGGAVSIVTELNKGTRIRVQVPAGECAPGAAAVDPTTIAISDLASTARASLSL